MIASNDFSWLEDFLDVLLHFVQRALVTQYIRSKMQERT